MLFNILTVTGAFGEISGLYLLGKKNPLGFIAFIMVCVYSVMIGLYDTKKSKEEIERLMNG